MKRFSFSTFLTDDSNRTACELCRDVAELRQAGPMPLVLLGDEGCGKTHLLYSIVNRVKASSSKAGLAYVTAHDFPEQVRALIDDPSPVERAHAAILLVDELERFTELTEELEAVVRIFLDNNHYVVMASGVHPSRAQNLTEGLRALVDCGRLVEIMPRESETQIELLKLEIRGESEAKMAAQREEILELRALLERVGKENGAAHGGELEDLRSQAAQAQSERADLARKLELAKAYSDSVQMELEHLREEHALLRKVAASGGADQSVGKEELERLREAFKVKDVELARAREESAELRKELARQVEAEEEVEQLREALSAARQDAEEHREAAEARALLEHEIEELRADLRQARSEGAQARHEANLLLERADKLLAQVEANRSQFKDAEAQHRKQVEDLEAMLANRVPAGLAAEEVDELRRALTETEAELELSRSEFARERQEVAERLKQTQRRLEQELINARDEAERARAEQERAEADMAELMSSLDEEKARRESIEAALQDVRAEYDELQNAVARADGEREGLRSRVSDLNQVVEELRAKFAEAEEAIADQQEEMESLRHEAAAQVAKAHAHAGELEGKVARLRAKLEQAYEAGSGVGDALRQMQAHLIATADKAVELTQKLCGDGNGNGDDAGSAADSWEHAELPHALRAPAGQESEWPVFAPDDIDISEGGLDDPDLDSETMIGFDFGEMGDLESGSTADDDPDADEGDAESEDDDTDDGIELPPTQLKPLRELTPLEDEPER